VIVSETEQPADAVYATAAEAFAGLVRRIPAAAWTGPGLGEWNLRELVGHTARSLTTVMTYLDAPAARVDIVGPVEYYAMVAAMSAADTAGVAERGRQAGRDLGPDPVATVDALVVEALARIVGRDDALITVFGGNGMRLSQYLPTRIFELAVHSLDIVAATGIDFVLPAEVCWAATRLAAQVAVANGTGGPVLRALTGRAPLPTGFSVVT
jgi:Mycothiol maleylpyruvate isomerase N-terminal domain